MVAESIDQRHENALAAERGKRKKGALRTLFIGALAGALSGILLGSGAAFFQMAPSATRVKEDAETIAKSLAVGKTKPLARFAWHRAEYSIVGLVCLVSTFAWMGAIAGLIAAAMCIRGFAEHGLGWWTMAWGLVFGFFGFAGSVMWDFGHLAIATLAKSIVVAAIGALFGLVYGAALALLEKMLVVRLGRLLIGAVIGAFLAIPLGDPWSHQDLHLVTAYGTAMSGAICGGLLLSLYRPKAEEA